jgi:DNA-binding NarL/FixJ family response regulator
MTETLSTPLPSWLHELGVVELTLTPSSVIPGGELRFSVTVTPPLAEPMPALLLLTDDAVPVAEWAIAVPTAEITVAMPNHIRLGAYELVVKRDDWELDAVVMLVENASDFDRSKTYDLALNSSARFTDSLSEGRLEEAYLHATAAASAYALLNSPGTAADLLRQCASALLAGGTPATASAAAFKALEFYQAAEDDLSAKSARHLLTRALEAAQRFGPSILTGKRADERLSIESGKTYSVLVASDLTLVREGLAALVEAQSSHKIVAQCSEGATALRRIEELRPDIALLDLNLPTLEVVRRVRKTDVPTKIVVLSTQGDREIVIEAFRCGVDGFLLKSDTSKGLLKAFGQVTAGGIYVSPELEQNEIFGVWKKQPIAELIDLYAESAPARTLKETERDYITAMLRETNGVIGGRSGAAARLGLARTTLIARMRRLGISPQTTASSKDQPDDLLELLSARENQVFSLLLKGVGAKEIAAQLSLSLKAVDMYRASLMRKLDVHDLAALAKRFARARRYDKTSG